MNKVIIFIVSFMLFSCSQKTELEKFDKNGKLIIYNEDVYARMWLENKNLDVTVIDTFCINQKNRVLKDIESGKLIYFGFHPREFKNLSKMLHKYGIETKEHLSRSIRLGGFEPYCYEEEMYNEIVKKYGETFIDSLLEIATKEFILENPNIEYIKDGIDLREKYK